MHRPVDNPIEPPDPTNISCLSASDWIQASPQSIFLKECASRNILIIQVTRDTFHLEMSTLKDFASLNIPRMSVTRDTSHWEMSALNDVASLNIHCTSVTRDTSHLEM